MPQLKVIAIVGPTSSGKTALGITVAKKFGGEVISADSRQVYKGLDIGTGKVTKREMAGVPHHMLSICSPKKQFSAGEFAKRAEKILADMYTRGRLPIVVGGTGFYADALLGIVALPEVPPNPALRKKLSGKTAPQLFSMLRKLDPVRAATIDPHNPVRLIRAIEIAKAFCLPASHGTSAQAGKIPPLAKITTPSKHHTNKLQFIGMVYDVLWLGIEVPQQKLEKKIRERLLARVKQGMIAEAKRLHRAGLSYKRMEELGLEYRYLAWHLQGKITRDEMIEQLYAAIRNYAKRQLRYLRRNKNIIWIKNERAALNHVRKFLS